MTKQILKNIPFALLDAVIPTNAQESSVFALPATASFIEVVAALSAAVATETVTCSIYGAEAVGGPFVLISTALVPANATNITQAFGAFCAFTHIKVILSSVTRVSSTLTVTVNAKDTVGTIGGSGTFNGNIIPAIDAAYTLGDATHNWQRLFVQEIDYGVAYIDLNANGINGVDFESGDDLYIQSVNPNQWLYMDGVGTAVELTGLQVDGKSSFGTSFVADVQTMKVQQQWSNTESVSGTTAGTIFRAEFTSTDLTAADGIINCLISGAFGNGAVAAIGTYQGFSNQLINSGSGSASNQTINGIWTQRTDIGTGYTQAIGPTTLAETIEFNAFGPIAVQPSRFNNINTVINNYYNGSPLVGKSGGLWIETATAAADGNDAIHLAATTFPVDVGLGIQGTSTGSGVGFTRAILIGSNGGVWTAGGASKIGTGIEIQNYTTRGLYINTPSGSPTASIEADGLIIGDTFKPTTAYKSTDGSTGATTTITTASLVGKTATFKNGLLVSFA